MPALFSNNASATLASSITATTTSITVSTGMGSLFPAASGGNYFYATITNSSNNLEIVKVTGRAADVLTVVRGQEGTTARIYAAADKIELRITAAVLTNFAQLDGAQAFTGDKTFSGTSGFSGAVSFSAAATFTGAITASSASLILPTAATPAQTAEGSIVWDPNDDLLTVGTGTVRKTFVDLDSTQTLDDKTLTSATVGLAGNALTTTNYRVVEGSGELAFFFQAPTVTGSIAGTVLTVATASAGNVQNGQTLTGTGVSASTTVTTQVTSAETLAASPTLASGGEAGTNSFVVSSATGIAAGQLVTGTGIPVGTLVGPTYSTGTTIPLSNHFGAPVNFTVDGAGTYTFYPAGGKGTYTVTPSQTVASTNTLTGLVQLMSLSSRGRIITRGFVTAGAAP